MPGGYYGGVPFPSKYEAANQGLLQGLTAGMMIHRQGQADKQLNLENERYTQRQTAAAQKHKQEGMMKLIEYSLKLPDNKRAGFIEAGAKSLNISKNEAMELVQLLSNPDSMTAITRMAEAAENGDVAGFNTIAQKNQISEAQSKNMWETIQGQKETEGLRQTDLSQQGIKPQIYTPDTLAVSPNDYKQVDKTVLGGSNEGLLRNLTLEMKDNIPYQPVFKQHELEKFQGAGNLRLLPDNRPSEITSNLGLLSPTYTPEQEAIIAENKGLSKSVLEKRIEGRGKAEKGKIQQFDVGSNTEYWQVDDKGNPIKKIEGMGGERFKPPSTTVNVGADNKFLGKLGEHAAESFTKSRENAVLSANTIGNIYDARKQLDAGIYAGTGATYKLAIDKMLQTAGINIGGETASNTETFAGATGKLVGKIIKDFGSGTGLSDADRDYAERIAGGKITLNEQSMRKLLDIAENAQRVQMKMHNKTAKEIEGKYSKEAMPYSMTVEEPSIYKKSNSKTAEEYLKKFGGK